MMDSDHSTCYQGMMNIGTRPTFDGHRQTLEANIFDFIGDLYGCELTVSFIERLRDERPFQSAEALAEQMRQDGDRAREILQVVN
jgi:riboflavin kinase/FMN adenylyltransferase